MVSGISSSSAASILEMWQNMLNKADTNSDGSVDETELTTVLQQNTSSAVSDIFSQLDTNQDNLISQIESNSGLAKLEQEMKNGGAGMSAVGGQPPPPPEKVFDTADTNEDGVVSKDELSAVMGQNGGNIDEIFSKVDTDGDGLISRAEDDAWLAQMENQTGQNSPLAGAGNAGQGIFDKADTDSDGSVSKDELAAVIGKDVDSLFGKIDTDGDGLISRAEDDAWLAQMENQTGQNSPLAGAGNAGQGIFETADTDGDGSVSKDELAAVIGKDVDSLFGKIDTDGDGLISQSEDAAWRETMGAQTNTTEASASGTGSASSSADSWQSMMFFALLKGFTAAAGASSESTSLYA
jgi:Ca2+-binding EF-hand superfamily protein